MAVTFTSLGYPGSIQPGAEWAQTLTLAGSGRYGVDGPGDWQATKVDGEDRKIRLSSGTGWGPGIVDTTEDADELTFGPVSTGVRYDMVVVRRAWGSTNASSFEVVPGGSARSLPSRAQDPGTLDEQPIWLVPVVSNSGGGALGTPIDLRVWQRDGGAFAMDVLAKQYLNAVGTRLRIGDVSWDRVKNELGSPTWKSASLRPVGMLAAGAGLTGTPPADAQFLMQGGTQAGPTDAAGYARITFPVPFPNGLLTFTLTNGDDAAGNALVFGSSGSGAHGGSAYGSRQDLVYRLWGPANGGDRTVVLPGFNHRVNWAAWGW